MSNFHSRIMNLPCDASTWTPMFQAVFKEGHKQAKADAAEIVAEADSSIDKYIARIEQLEDALQEILYTHANDDVRPRAYYIASKALEHTV